MLPNCMFFVILFSQKPEIGLFKTGNPLNTKKAGVSSAFFVFAYELSYNAWLLCNMGYCEVEGKRAYTGHLIDASPPPIAHH